MPTGRTSLLPQWTDREGHVCAAPRHTEAEEDENLTSNEFGIWELKLELKSLTDHLQLIGCLVLFRSIAHLGYADLGMANHCTVRGDDIPHGLTPAALCPTLLLHEPTITMLR